VSQRIKSGCVLQSDFLLSERPGYLTIREKFSILGRSEQFGRKPSPGIGEFFYGGEVMKPILPAVDIFLEGLSPDAYQVLRYRVALSLNSRCKRARKLLGMYPSALPRVMDHVRTFGDDFGIDPDTLWFILRSAAAVETRICLGEECVVPDIGIHSEPMEMFRNPPDGLAVHAPFDAFLSPSKRTVPYYPRMRVIGIHPDRFRNDHQIRRCLPVRHHFSAVGVAAVCKLLQYATCVIPTNQGVVMYVDGNAGAPSAVYVSPVTADGDRVVYRLEEKNFAPWQENVLILVPIAASE
jgi:hypothetical protein